jgi:hypothetical protein
MYSRPMPVLFGHKFVVSNFRMTCGGRKRVITRVVSRPGFNCAAVARVLFRGEGDLLSAVKPGLPVIIFVPIFSRTKGG